MFLIFFPFYGCSYIWIRNCFSCLTFEVNGLNKNNLNSVTRELREAAYSKGYGTNRSGKTRTIDTNIRGLVQCWSKTTHAQTDGGKCVTTYKSNIQASQAMP